MLTRLEELYSIKKIDAKKIKSLRYTVNTLSLKQFALEHKLTLLIKTQHVNLERLKKCYCHCYYSEGNYGYKVMINERTTQDLMDQQYINNAILDIMLKKGYYDEKIEDIQYKDIALEE